jgi:hypothetical protein
MGDSLKKGIGTKYLLPIVAAYAGAAALLGFERVVEAGAVLRHAGAAGLTGVVLLVLQDLMPRPAKEVLVFWRLRDRVPGCRAFSEIAKRDDRVDPTDLAVLLPPGPMSAKEQNALWYRWLKSVEADPGIADSHYRFLALRDCAALLFMLTLATPLVTWVVGRGMKGALILAAVCLGGYFVTAVAARNAAVRLVGNVIARKVATS